MDVGKVASEMEVIKENWEEVQSSSDQEGGQSPEQQRSSRPSFKRTRYYQLTAMREIMVRLF